MGYVISCAVIFIGVLCYLISPSPYNSRFLSKLLSHYPHGFKTKLSPLFLTISHVPISHHLPVFCLLVKHQSLAFQKCLLAVKAGSQLHFCLFQISRVHVACDSALLADFLGTQCPDQNSMPWQTAWRALQPKRSKACFKSNPALPSKTEIIWVEARIPKTVSTGLSCVAV